MKYPEHPQDGEWYLVTCKAKAWDHDSLSEEWKRLGKTGEPTLSNGVIWYFNHEEENAVTGIKHFQAGHYDSVYLSLERLHDQESITLGCVDVTSKSFPEKWRTLLLAGKQRVDLLNSMDKTLGYSDVQCANCESEAIEDDYLCQQCRNNVSSN